MMGRDWNSAYEDDDTPWDKGYAAPPLVEYLERCVVQGRVLVPGCGSGHDVRLLAEQGAMVTGLDIAPSAVKKAVATNSSENARYCVGDFLDLEKQYVGAFDFVFEHTCLCAIDPSQRTNYVDSLRRALKPDGSYLAIFFREVSDYDGSGPPHPIDTQEIEALFSESFDTVESFTPKKTYPSRPLGSEEIRLMRLRS